MSASLFNVFQLLCIFLSSDCWPMRDCGTYNSSDFINKEETAENMAFGDCSFTKTLCNYTQACTIGDAQNWTIMNGRAVCPGRRGLYDSFSILVSPLLQLEQNTSLSFSYSQKLPGTLSVILITSTDITNGLVEKGQDGAFDKLLFIGPSTLKIGFRARKAETGFNVTLSNVKLQLVSNCTPNPNHLTTMAASPLYSLPATSLSTKAVTTMATSPPYTQPTSNRSTQADHLTTTATSPMYSQQTTNWSTQAELTGNSETTDDKDGNNAAIVAGVIVPVIVVIVVVVVGAFIWRRRKQKLHGTPKEDITRQGCKEHAADTTNMSSFISGLASYNTSSANSYEHLVNYKSKSGHGALETSSSHYDIPHNGQPAKRHTAGNMKSLPPLARDLPSAGDDDGHNYNVLEAYSTAAAPQTATSVYSYARGEEHSPSKSNHPHPVYNRMGSAEARSRLGSEAGSDAVEDEYIYIASTDAVAGVRSQAAASHPTGWNGHPGQNSEASEGDSSCDQHTSLDCEDGYSVLSAGNKQVKAFNDQRSEGAEKAYGRLASNVHGDYDKIRRKDRDDVMGNDYNHVGGRTEGDYDEMGRADKEKIIGNDYDHLV